MDEALCRREAERARALDPAFARWAAGREPIRHDDVTQARVFALVERLRREGVRGDGVDPWALLEAADRLACAGMWLAVHQVYAHRVHLDGRPLEAHEFKRSPEGHLGGVLNMVPAYVGYLAANALAGRTRSWLMGQGHCVSAVDSVNLLVGNLGPAHAERYAVSDEGLTRYTRDFYSYALDERGRQDSPIGSHVNAHTAGGILEGGYLGFAELLYPHMPLPGESLVAFLSDGAFEEQRGGDWAPRWWRPFDCGVVAPIMIWNGRRIDQRTTLAQSGGSRWFLRHLRLHGFDPILLDGTDPAAYVFAIFEMERRAEAAGLLYREGEPYTIPLAHGLAMAPKGAGFYGAGTNPAHNLPLPGSPREDVESARLFRAHARRLWVEPEELEAARACFRAHAVSGRPREREHPLAVRQVKVTAVPELAARPVPADRARVVREGEGFTSSPMDAIDEGFLAWVRAHPGLRPRVGNPDEMRSNRLERTLEALRFRVTAPEPGLPESVDGAVITALNEEAVCAAALGNKGGINLVATYEAFGTKMLGEVRQEILFAGHQQAAGRPPGWLSVPLVLTSHTWENGKNEQSHQDPSMAEALLGEPSHLARVLFAADHNTALALIEGVYQTQGQIWALVVPKRGSILDLFSLAEGRRMLAEGALEVTFAGHRPEASRLLLTAVGAYALREVLRASVRLAERDQPHRVVAMLEPGRFRRPRSEREAAHGAAPEVLRRLVRDEEQARLFVSHTRPEPLLGVLAPLTDGVRARGLGYTGHGGTLDADGMLFVNGCSWAHTVRACAELLDRAPSDWLSRQEVEALEGRRNPMGVVIPHKPHAQDVMEGPG